MALSRRGRLVALATARRQLLRIARAPRIFVAPGRLGAAVSNATWRLAAAVALVLLLHWSVLVALLPRFQGGTTLSMRLGVCGLGCNGEWRGSNDGGTSGAGSDSEGSCGRTVTG